MAQNPTNAGDDQTADKKVSDAEAKALEAQAKADDAAKSPEQRKADKASADADRARSEAALAATQASAVADTMTVAEARMLVPGDGAMSAGDHMAQKFGNYPENPAPAHADHSDPEKMTVGLSMIVPDLEGGRRTTKVHPDMVGDYIRAGWQLV